MRKKRRPWKAGDVFLVQQRDGWYNVGQVLDHIMPNAASIALYDVRVSDVRPPTLPLRGEAAFAVASVTRDALDSGLWPVVAESVVPIAKKFWPNEQFRKTDWIGSEVYSSNIIDEFLDAFWGLVPWDDWNDPDFLDRLLLSPEKKPRNLIYKAR